jgi:BNR repeat-like domain
VGCGVKRTGSALHFAVLLLLLLAAHGASAAGPGFTPQKRIGHTTGDQWEPTLAADGHGHVYVLYPQYGTVRNCPGCAVPTITLLVSSDNGLTWQSPQSLMPSSTGQFDPQIVVDPADRQTLYASWLQNNRRDVMVARSADFGRTWFLAVADRAQEDADKPVLAVRGLDVYVGFNHERKFLVAASHDAGNTFTSVNVNANAEPGWSLAGGGTVDSTGNVYFSWTAYARQDMAKRPMNVYISRSQDGGHAWTTTLLDVSAAPPDCDEQVCGTGYLSAQAALASDSTGTIYALWNAGSTNGGPERIYFSSSTTAGASWSARSDVSTADRGVESGFPAITAGAAGDVRVAWMDARMGDAHGQPLWNTFYRSSTNGGATWSAESRLSGPLRGYDYILPGGFRFPFGDYFGIAIDGEGATHAVWGEGRNYKSPGSIWYTHGR